MNFEWGDAGSATTRQQARLPRCSALVGPRMVVAILLLTSCSAALACPMCTFERMGNSLEIHMGVRLVVGMLLAALYFDFVRFLAAWVVYEFVWYHLYRFFLWNLIAASGGFGMVSYVGFTMMALGVLDAVVIMMLARIRYLRACPEDRMPLYLPFLYLPASVLAMSIARVKGM